MWELSWGGRIVGLVIGILQLGDQLTDLVAQLGAHEITRGHLADAGAQRGDLAGQEVHVGARLGGDAAIVLQAQLVTCLLTVLRQQDQAE